MHIEKAVIKNFKTLKDVSFSFNEQLNIIVGDNESGKSTLLEAVHLALSGQINGRAIQGEMHPLLFNVDVTKNYIQALIDNKPIAPPAILVELYLNEDPSLSRLKGTNNSLKKNVPGVSLSIEFDEAFSSELEEYIKKPDSIRSIPIEYYTVKWRSFSFDNITSRSIPLRPVMIDASLIRHNSGANKYLLDIMKEFLNNEQRAQLSLSYRKMKDSFLKDDNVTKINSRLSEVKDDITDRKLSISLDISSRSNWENGIETHLDDIPLPLVGKGEQSCVKIKLAMESSSAANVFLIEEPENHLSHSNLNQLINKISEKSKNKQLIITTHSSFVLNKLGIENVILFSKTHESITLKSLDPKTKDYFLKLPGYETLRLILSSRAILVEGPSDELIVQKAFFDKFGCMPIEKGVDVITVNSLAFKRFLEISDLLSLKTNVVTDNDGDLLAIEKKYEDYKDKKTIKLFYDSDVSYKTLEPQMLKANGRTSLNKILGKDFATDQELLDYMQNNKTDVALSIFNTKESVVMPSYILNSINE